MGSESQLSMNLNPFLSFDAIYCISIAANRERQQSCMNVARDLGIPLQFHLVEKSPQGGTLGCFMSHVELVKKLYDGGLRNALILEDDIVASKGYSGDVMTQVARFIETDNEWEILQLGYSPMTHYYDVMCLWKLMNAKRISSNIIQFMGLLTHAYCVSRKGMKRIVEESEKVVPYWGMGHETPYGAKLVGVDSWYCQIFKDNKGVYATAPIQFDQKWCIPTDNRPTVLIERILWRRFQCYAEKTKLFHYCSCLPLYHNVIIFLMVLTLAVVGMLVKRARKVHVVVGRVRGRRGGSAR